MSTHPKLEIVDGRSQRSERSRTAIIVATLSLLDDGNLAPTARQIAKEAGVGLRSFFRHFDDMEALLTAVDAHLRAFYEQLFLQKSHAASLKDRFVDVVNNRSVAYERVKTIILSTQAQLWRSKVLQKNYARNQHLLRQNLEDLLPELIRLAPETREAMHAITAFEMWHRLRYHQKLSIDASREVIITTGLSLIGEGAK